MQAHRGITGAVAAVAAFGAAATTAAFGTTPKDQRTHPHVQPASGDSDSSFTVLFTLRQSPGHQGVMATSYRVQVTPPGRSASACWPPQPAPVTRGHEGQTARVPLPSPTQGWCHGRYAVTVLLERGPYCPSRSKPCPEFATQELKVGRTHFTVR